MKNENCEHRGGRRFLTILGGVALALAAAALVSQLHDIRRYIKIVRM